MYEINRLAPLRWWLHGAAMLALSVCLSSAALAQQAPTIIRLSPDDAERGLNGPQHNFDFLAPGVTGDNYQTAGFFGQKLRPYLASNPEALAHLDDYRRQKTLFLIDRIVAVGAFGLYGQQILARDERQYFNNTQKVALSVFATSVLATVFISRNTNSHLRKAVNCCNTGLAQGGMGFRLRPAAIGFGAAPTGQPLLALRWALR
jgi:hypothetical protein